MIYARGGKWCVTVYDPSKKGNKRWVGTYETRAEAEAAEERAKPRGPRNPSCRDFAEQWPIEYPRPAVLTNKTRGYAVKSFSERFGDTPLAQLDWLEARKWGRRAPDHVLSAVRAMMNDAIEDRLYLDTNPFAKLGRPTPRGRRDLEVITEEQLYGLADTAVLVWGEYGRLVFRPLILFAAYVICRPHELFFLERSCIQGDEVLILKADDSTGNAKLPKNNNQRRVILPPPAAEAISVIPPRIDVPWLFYTQTGKRFSKSNHYYYWNPVKKAFGMPDMDFYELKHFGASLMVNELEIDDADVALQVGHTDGGELIRTVYGHPEEKRARERMKQKWRRHMDEAAGDLA